MSVYAYTHSDAENASENLNTVMSNIESTLSEMGTDLQKLSAGWEGSEQENYRGVHGKWSSAAENLRNILGEVRRTLDENTASVIETRNRASNSISG